MYVYQRFITLPCLTNPFPVAENWMWDRNRIYGEGSQWHILSHAFAEYVATSTAVLEVSIFLCANECGVFFDGSVDSILV